VIQHYIFAQQYSSNARNHLEIQERFQSGTGDPQSSLQPWSGLMNRQKPVHNPLTTAG
jgi:hypothetical protein